MGLKRDTPVRDVTEIGGGDYIQLGHQHGYRWECVFLNSAFGAERPPQNWEIQTSSGRTYSMWDVHRYAKAEDMQA